MKHLQIKYSLLHFMFFISYCAVVGYTAIFLQSKGMSNSEIGIVTGIGAASTIFLSPIISSLVGKIKGLTVTKLLVILYM
ncbi:MAG: MFS transporter, partial [Erysipelotrichaceae bacterium]|nr:MFS transporter [Erysipelotrichaceae bacterium]